MITASSERERTEWAEGYVEAVVRRELRELSSIHALNVMPQLLKMMAARTAQPPKIASLASEFNLNRGTIDHYLGLLIHTFHLASLSAWRNIKTGLSDSDTRHGRLSKKFELHFCDTGLACTLLKLSAPTLYRDREIFGRFLKTFVFHELLGIDKCGSTEHSFSHFLHYDGPKVDFVIQRSYSEVAGVEVKASETVTPKDFRGLRKLQKMAGKDFVAGVVLYMTDGLSNSLTSVCMLSLYGHYGNPLKRVRYGHLRHQPSHWLRYWVNKEMKHGKSWERRNLVG